MNIPLNTKFFKISVAALALVTTSTIVAPTTITNLTTVSAKAKKHHKKVKKANSTYKVPKVKEFTKNIENKYYINHKRWAKTTLTFNDSKLTNEQQQIVEDAIEQINNLGIVTLKKTNKKADIEYQIASTDNINRLGDTRIESSDDYKGLRLIEKATTSIYINSFNDKHNFKLMFNQMILHETGHALGLNHVEQVKYEIMSPTGYEDRVKTDDNIHTTIDQDYINGLAILYQN